MALGIPLAGIEGLGHLQRPLVIPPRLPVVALLLKQNSQVVQVGGQVRMALGITLLPGIQAAWLISSARCNTPALLRSACT